MPRYGLKGLEGNGPSGSPAAEWVICVLGEAHYGKVSNLMTDHHDASANGSARLREVPIEWEALEDAFENNAPEVHSYLHLKTGEVLRVVDGIADPQMHARVASDPEYVRIEPVSSREQYRWMERFIQMLEASPLRQVLQQAIDGKGAFRRFKDVLMTHAAERERWFNFRSVRLRGFMEAWLTAHLLEPTLRTEGPTVALPAPHSAAPADLDAGLGCESLRQTRGATKDTLKQQLLEAVEGLRPRDLEKVLTFAEFVRARRASRLFGPASEGSIPVPDELQTEPEARTNEEPPSSRRLPALR